MTITGRGDKIASVADDRNTATEQTILAGDAEAERPGRREVKKLLTEPFRCDKLYRLSLGADRKGSRRAEQENKKVLGKAKEF